MITGFLCQQVYREQRSTKPYLIMKEARRQKEHEESLAIGSYPLQSGESLPDPNNSNGLLPPFPGLRTPIYSDKKNVKNASFVLYLAFILQVLDNL